MSYKSLKEKENYLKVHKMGGRAKNYYMIDYFDKKSNQLENIVRIPKYALQREIKKTMKYQRGN